MEIFYNAVQKVWYAYDGDTGRNYAYSSYCSSVPTSSGFTSENQEPFAFESYDSTASDFSSVYMNVNPAWSYATTGSFQTPAHDWAINSASAGSWGYFVGGGGAVPSGFVIAGNAICSSLSVGQIYIGSNTQGILKSCGTQTYDVKLW